MLRYTLSLTYHAWPMESGRDVSYTGTLMSLRTHIRNWRLFMVLEGNLVYNVALVRKNDEPERDLAHEADMARLRNEQLRADISVEEANEEAFEAMLSQAWDDYDF